VPWGPQGREYLTCNSAREGPRKPQGVALKAQKKFYWEEEKIFPKTLVGKFLA
jgi:hypothetical protein